jgi:sugar lactone lactonase YvrE
MNRIAWAACFVLFLSCASSDGNAEKSKKPPVVWEASDGMASPESAHKNAEFLYVSQIGGGGPVKKDGDGYIAKLTADGKMVDVKWCTGLNAPKGMCSHGGTLWVSDIDRLVAIDLEKGEIQKEVAFDGAEFLNDVACDAQGAVFVSDMVASRIYRYADDAVAVFAEGPELEYPNGLLVERGDLVVGAWGDQTTGKPGHLYRLDLQTGKQVLITPQPLGNLDGVAADGQSGYLVSDWVAGKVYRVAADGTATAILTLPQGTADLGYDAARHVLILPRMVENKVTAFDLSKDSR